ncbi:MAG: DUF4147 domain-containing protein, partial [Paracoccaceae bacterium]
MRQAALLERIWRAGIAAVEGGAAVTRALEDPPVPPPDRILAVGKAAVPMASAALARFSGRPALAVTKHGYAEGAPPGLEVIEAGHPLPDAGSLEAGAALRRAVAACGPGDHLLLLVS